MNNEKLMLGFAEVDITPRESMEMIGFGREDEMSRGILHPLSLQVAIWAIKNERACLVTIDHIGFSRQHAENLRREIGQILGITEESVMLCFSHCHSAPNESASPRYYLFVCEQAKKAVKEALHNMSAVKGAWGNADTDIGLNRRKDSKALDRRLGIFKVCDAQSGEIRLLLLRLTAHCNVLKADNYLISPDYFGTVRDLLGAKYHCPVMVTQGAAGNVAPKYFKSVTNPPDAADERFIRSNHALEEMAESVLQNTMPVIEALQPKNIDRLSMYVRFLPLTADVPSYERALEVADEAGRFCGIDGTGWLAEVKNLNNGGVHQQTDTTEIQFLAIGEGCLCGVANEIMTEYSLRTAELLQNEFFYFGGYTNGCMGYFPTEEEFDKGGYEVYWSMLVFYMYYGRVFPLRRESASELIAYVAENAPA